MTIHYVQGDLFLSRAQTLAQGVNCRGRMGAGIAVEFRRLAAEMYQEYRRRCHHRQLRPGDLFLWTASTPWILNMATQDSTGGARPNFVDQCFRHLAADYDALGITSIAMPKVAAGLGGLPWDDVRNSLEQCLGNLPVSIYVYEEYVEGVQADEPALLCPIEPTLEPTRFSRTRTNPWRALSNFEIAPVIIDGKQYRTVEHFLQASKATTDWEHEMVRLAASPAQAKRLGRALDNVMIERLWRTVKYEEVYLKEYASGTDLYEGLRSHFDFYCSERKHSSLDHQTPAEVYRSGLSKRVASSI